MNRPRFPAGIAEKIEYEVVSPKIPKGFEGFKIAHISDTHSQPAGGVLEIISAEKPDITVITGDILHDDKKPAPKVEALMKELLKISPVYFITGNHDVWREDKDEIFEVFTKMGARLLENEMTLIGKGDDEIALFGVDDPVSRKPAEVRDILKQNLSCLAGYEGYKILLFHRANLFDDIKGLGYDLILSGHMHGGQMRIGKLGGLLAPSSALFSGKRMIFPKYCFGKVTWGQTTMLINRGISNTLPLPRWGNKPEVGIVTLKRTCKK